MKLGNKMNLFKLFLVNPQSIIKENSELNSLSSSNHGILNFPSKSLAIKHGHKSQYNLNMITETSNSINASIQDFLKVSETSDYISHLDTNMYMKK